MNKATVFIFGGALGFAAGALSSLALTRGRQASAPGDDSAGGETGLGAKLAGCRDSAIRAAKDKLKGLKGEEPMSEEELRTKIAEARERIAARMEERAKAEAGAEATPEKDGRENPEETGKGR